MGPVAAEKEWALAEAKNKFSEVFSKAMEEGPQRIRRRGDVVVVLSEAEYSNLVKPRKDFVQYLMEGPGFEGVDLTRDKSLPRDIEL